MIVENWNKKMITRIGFFRTNGGNLFVQELRSIYGTEDEDDDSQHTICLAESMEEMRRIRDWLNSLDLEEREEK